MLFLFPCSAERAERARAREERQWLIANGEDIPTEFATNLRKHDDDDESSQDTDPEKLKQRTAAEYVLLPVDSGDI